ncbi:MAG: methylisocitrate lyase [Novosphingobium sp.]|nr:methylisocitrate lyase [Novosphingobium sp.]
MTYLLAENTNPEPAGTRFRRLAEAEPILQLPGAYNGLSALQAKAADFEALYLSGAAMSASMGLPDLGILTIEDVCFHIRQIARVSQLPILVDGDTGFGEALNVMQMVRAFEEAGAGAVQIEDQLLPKKCGHLNDKKLASADDMAAKVAAARKARRHLYIVARTDALEREGLDGAIARAKLYVEAGADAIFPEALNDSNAFAQFSSEVEVPLLANMTEFGRTPFMTAEQFQALGFAMVIWPVSALRMAARSHEELYATIREHGWTKPVVDRMQTRAELYATIGYHDYEELDGSIARSLVPNGNPED